MKQEDKGLLLVRRNSRIKVMRGQGVTRNWGECVQVLYHWHQARSDFSYKPFVRESRTCEHKRRPWTHCRNLPPSNPSMF